MRPARRGLARTHILIAAAIAAIAIATLLAMGRPPICTCGTIELWHGAVDAGNSQHVADWYTPSHVVHGFLFYALGWLLLRRRPVGERLVLAVLIEAAWEVIENTPFVIDRYREATIALGYTGDSVLNSAADIGWMVLGFLLAWRLPVAATVALAAALELLALWVIRDNLTLNVLMLLWPIEAVRAWQGGT
ncbi:DUF2585 domain-containing protein [Sphingomonas fennica]|uniref:UPF0314 protein CV103_09955 n=1 Tax=Edaphosphingomonas fennica TaxID=114404 RepID=A0A2T4I0H8_9SPHN|nr:DUF2585 domain-containing protein [Sphingomonas fennica]PTD22139.1 hypothetical protein CV103_09955 [Sphingomonas fennica]